MELYCFNCGNVFNSLLDHNCSSKKKVRNDEDTGLTGKQNTILEDTREIKDEKQCSKCEKRFYSKYTKLQHEKRCRIEKERKTNITRCKFCQQNFSMYSNRMRHEKKCKEKDITNSGDNMRTDKQAKIEAEPKPSTSREQKDEINTRLSINDNVKVMKHDNLKCRLCNSYFPNHVDLYNHRVFQHYQSGENRKAFQSVPWNETDFAPWEKPDGTIDRDLELTYNQHKHLILKQKITELTNEVRYNFPVTNNLSVDEMLQQIDEIYHNSEFSFKVNISFGTVLIHVETNKYRYFAPYYNQTLFTQPFVISEREDIQKLEKEIKSLDVINYITQQRPDTKYRPVMITNILYTIYKTSYPLGKCKKLPNFIRKNKYIIPFDSHPVTKKPYDDEKCFFRSLAYHEKGSVFIEKRATVLYEQWLTYCKENKLKSSDITFKTICYAEDCFDININIYSLLVDKSIKPIYKSRLKQNNGRNIMYLNLFENHLSYITKFRTFAHKFKCKDCQKLFPYQSRLKIHEQACKRKQKPFRFPGGYFKQQKSIFDKIEDIGIKIPSNLKTFPWFSVFDLESVLVPTNNTENQSHNKLQKTSTHVPICVCLCSNVPGFTKEHFIFNENLDGLLSEMISYLTKISQTVEKLAFDRWKIIFDELDRLEEEECGQTEFISEINESVRNGDKRKQENESRLQSRTMESNETEASSSQFNRAISKENVYYKFLKNIEKRNVISNVEYNNWGNTDNETEFADFEDKVNDVNIEDYEILAFRSLNKIGEEEENEGVNEDVDDEDDVVITDDDREENDDEDDDDDDDDDDDVITDEDREENDEDDDDDDEDDDDDHDDDEDDDEENDEQINEKLKLITDTANRKIEGNKTNDKEQDIDFIEKTANQLTRRKIKNIRDEFERYCKQIPVIGFNSGKYDINLIKSKLAIHLKLHSSKVKKFIVKKNNNYICISNGSFRFLDLLNYLPAGTSYSSFLNTFEVSMKKSFFPYEYLTDVSKLNDKNLPPKESFFSTLKKCNVLESKIRVKYDILTQKENKTETEALQILELENIPDSIIDENYQNLLDIWKEKNMKTMRDFLQYYAELDVGPMVEGIEIFQKYFFDGNIDVFKSFISLPGIARKMLYDSGIKNGGSFSLLDRFDEDLYHTFMNNLTGGASIIFTRKHVIGETFIRQNKKFPCRSIYGYDANSLYLWAICQDMPVGRYIRRLAEDDFKPKHKKNYYYSMFDWMEWVNFKEKKQIKHRMNSGSEYRIGPYFVDGINIETNEVYEFLGDFWHGNPNMKWKDEIKQTERYKKTMNRLAYIKSQGYKINVIWEKDYREMIKSNEEMKNFVNQRQPLFYKKYPKEVDENLILESVLNDDLFGFVECDIKVPDSWSETKFKPNTEFSPYDYFKEMSPIFCSTDIPYEKIGEHMQNHVEEHGLSKEPRRLLVGGMKAKNFLLFTPLLKWYLTHGLVVSNIYQVIEYNRMKCFSQFGEEVTKARREGDKHPHLKVIAMLMKLIGNAAFGGTIMNKEKHRNIKYVKGFYQSCLAVNNPNFVRLNEIDDSYFETENLKKQIKVDNPIQLGIAILNYAKIHMLSFYYDFMDKFIDRNCFEYIEVDTDSAYFALSGESIQSVVKPEMREKFNFNVFENCNDDYSSNVGENDVWLTRECCRKHNKFDCRQMGIMKIEMEARHNQSYMIGLCSKSYIVKSTETSKVKYSLKGINNCFVDPSNYFQKVLSEKSPLYAKNTGITLVNNTLHTYQQDKKAFTYYYIKRKILSNGINSEPLDLELTPTKKQKR